MSLLTLAVVLAACREPSQGEARSFVDAIASMKHSIAPFACLPRAASGNLTPGPIAGTVFFVTQRGAFLTAGHVVTDLRANKFGSCEANLYLPKDGDWSTTRFNIPAQSFGVDLAACLVDQSVDVALCRTNQDLSTATGVGLRVAPVALAIDLPRDGTDIAFTGFPLHIQTPRTSRAIIGGYENKDPEGRYTLWIDKTDWPGVSGGPIYTLDGSVVGMILARGNGDAAGIGLGRTANILTEFLSANLASLRPQK